MSLILLGVTGSVAAVRTPALCATLTASGHQLAVVATEPSLYFFDPSEIEGGPPHGPRLFRDADEWPGTCYERGDPVQHIVLRDWADVLVVAPLDANTLAKFALGLADNFLTCVFRAWDFRKPVVLAPAMNTLMWENPVTRRHLSRFLDDHGDGRQPEGWTLSAVDAIFAQHAPRIVLVPPQSKRLACGDIGVGAMAEVATIAEAVRCWAEGA
jgi:phosphopantothenoylcysteine decarboxylase